MRSQGAVGHLFAAGTKVPHDRPADRAAVRACNSLLAGGCRVAPENSSRRVAEAISSALSALSYITQRRWKDRRDSDRRLFATAVTRFAATVPPL